MNEQMPNFEWSDDDKRKLHTRSTVTCYWEIGVETVTLYSGGVFCLNDAVPKLRIGADKYVALAHCDPKTLREPVEEDSLEQRVAKAQTMLEEMASADDYPTADDLRRVIAVLKGDAKQ